MPKDKNKNISFFILFKLKMFSLKRIKDFLIKGF